MAKILVIIPSYNEKDTVIVLIEKLFHLNSLNLLDKKFKEYLQKYFRNSV